MHKMHKQLAKIMFWLFLTLYVGVLLANPQFGPLDDWMFLDTIQRDKWLPFSTFMIGGGRFYPLNGWEYNFVMRVLPTVPLSYYLFNATQLILFTLIFCAILKRITNNQALIYGVSAIVITTSGFIYAWFRLLVPERGSLFGFSIFIYSYLRFIESKRWLFVITSLIFANIALYYKEPGFLMLGSFALGHLLLLLSWKKKDIPLKILDVLLLLSAVIFGLSYYFIVYIHQSGRNYAEIIGIKESIEDTLHYFITWEPILPFCLIPALLLRGYQLLFAKQPAHPIYDSMVWAALVYLVAFLKIGITNPYYLLPTYVFAIPAFLFFLQQQWSNRWDRCWGVAAVVLSGILYLNGVATNTILHQFFQVACRR